MINLIEGRINLGTKNIFVVSDCEDLNVLAEEGLIEARKNGGDGRTYYYVEAVEDGVRFGVFITMHERRIKWLLLRWLDSPIKGWDDVSEKALKDEYRLLLNFIEKMVGRPPDKKGNRERTWRFKWGQVDVSYEPRSFDAAIFMVPR
jgi:hypothetical protein